MKFGIRPDDLATPRREPRGIMGKEETQRLDYAAKSSVLEGRAVDEQLRTKGKVEKTLDEGK